jgi:dimethylaniline monooxygenase (N-oxide forming)
MDYKNVRHVAVIGAGEAGVATAKMLIDAGIRCTVFERNDRIGGVWTTGYLDFGIQVQRELYEFPDFPQPADAPDFTPGEQICAYIQDYADHFGVTPHIRFSTTVTDVSERSDGVPGWAVSSMNHAGVYREENFDYVVVAIGVYSHTPHMPAFPGIDRFKGSVIHSCGLQSKEQLHGRKVMVIGAGKSATDAAILAADHGASSTIVFRNAHWPVPAKLLGFLPFKYALFTRFANAMLPLHVRASRWARVWHRAGKPLIWTFWRIVEQLLIIQCGLKRPMRGRSATRTNLMPRERIESDCFSNAAMLPKPEFYKYIHSGRIGVERAGVRAYTDQGVELSNGRNASCDLVILATGWDTDYGFLAKHIFDRIGFESDGYHLYRQILHPDIPNMAFIGSNASTYINILTHNLQARWLVELILGRHSLPAHSAMVEEVEATRQWKRRVMPFSKSRAATLHLHMQQYHDELLQDMGASKYRKRGVIGWAKEIFAPYQPRDYKLVSSGDEFKSTKRSFYTDRRGLAPFTALLSNRKPSLDG